MQGLAVTPLEIHFMPKGNICWPVISSGLDAMFDVDHLQHVLYLHVLSEAAVCGNDSDLANGDAARKGHNVLPLPHYTFDVNEIWRHQGAFYWSVRSRPKGFNNKVPTF